MSKKLLIIPLIFLLLSFPLQDVVKSVWDSWVNYNPPIRIESVGNANISFNGIYDHVIIVLVDGARPDLIPNISGFDFLKKNGIIYSNAHAITPTYSVPARAAIATGLPHELTGVSSNWYNKGYLGIPNIFSLAKEKGLSTGAIGDSSIKMLFGKYLDFYFNVSEVPGHMNRSTEIFLNLATIPNLLWIGFADIDEAGHAYGASSNAYKDALNKASDLLLKIIQRVDDKTLLIVLSDHGHLDRGGHGGIEKEVMSIYLALYSKNLSPKVVLREVSYASIAPTVAYVLGLPPKLVASEMPLYEVTGANVSYYASLLADNYYNVLEKIAMKNKVKIENVSISPEISKIEDAYNILTNNYNRIKDVMVNQDFISRGILVIVILIILISSFVILFYFRFYSRRGFITGMLAFVVFLIYFSFKYTFSMSSINDVNEYILTIMIGTIISMFSSIFLIMEKDIMKAYLSMFIFLTTIFLIPILNMSISYGFFVKFPFPDWNLAFLYYTSMLSLVFIFMFNWLMFIVPFITNRILIVRKFLS
jgi:hypothetical protein